MSNIATTIGQARKLIELGLPVDSADMYYPYLGAGQYGDIPRVGFPLEYYSGGRDIPAWSLSALLEVMPNNDYWDIYLCQAQDGKWQSVFHDCEFSNGEYKDFIADTPFTAAYEMVCWLLENGHIKEGGER